MTGPVVLVLRALGLGDLLTTVPALRGLRAAFPGHRLVLAGPAALGGFAVDEGLVDAAVDVRPWQVPDVGPVDVAVDLHGRGPQSHRVLQALRPGRLVAYASTEAGHAGPEWRGDEPEVARWCRLLAESGVPCDPADLRLRPDPPERVALAVVHPGAASGARRWPPERHAAVARHLAASGLDVLVSAGPGEQATAERVAELAGLGRGVVTSTGLRELADLLARAALLVVGDTGVGHLGTACGTPSVRLFGPVEPALWGPSIDPDRHVVLWHGPSSGADPTARVGAGDPHSAVTDPALAAVTVAEVVQAADRVLARSAPGRPDAGGRDPRPAVPCTAP